MKAVGIFEAKTRLSALIADVECGERIIITRRGEPVAELVRPHAPAAGNDAVTALLANQTPLGLPITEAIAWGRR